jgi:hypothetical protein
VAAAPPPLPPLSSTPAPHPRGASTPSGPAAATSPSPPPSANPSPTQSPLIRLDRPFNVDEFATMLGETTIRVTVPRESLLEVLRRVTDFMGFGIYVYSLTVRPAPSELLKEFVVELQRVDFAPGTKTWVPFEEKGTAESPFGPGGP